MSEFIAKNNDLENLKISLKMIKIFKDTKTLMFDFLLIKKNVMDYIEILIEKDIKNATIFQKLDTKIKANICNMYSKLHNDEISECNNIIDVIDNFIVTINKINQDISADAFIINGNLFIKYARISHMIKTLYVECGRIKKKITDKHKIINTNSIDELKSNNVLPCDTETSSDEKESTQTDTWENIDEELDYPDITSNKKPVKKHDNSEKRRKVFGHIVVKDKNGFSDPANIFVRDGKVIIKHGDHEIRNKKLLSFVTTQMKNTGLIK